MSTTQTTPSSLIDLYVRKLAIAAIAFTLVVLAWSNLFLNININANAATLDGVSNQVEGKVQKDIGTARRAAGDILDNPMGEAKGALNQAQGRAKQDIGTTQNKLDDAQDTLEDTSNNIVDSVKDFFN